MLDCICNCNDDNDDDAIVKSRRANSLAKVICGAHGQNESVEWPGLSKKLFDCEFTFNYVD